MKSTVEMFALFNIDLFYQQSKIDSDNQDAEYKICFLICIFIFFIMCITDLLLIFNYISFTIRYLKTFTQTSPEVDFLIFTFTHERPKYPQTFLLILLKVSYSKISSKARN